MSETTTGERVSETTTSEHDERPLRILHLSDTHLFGDDTLHYGMVDTAAALGRVLARASEIEGVDVVVLSGDLSDDGSAASYEKLRELVEPWAAAHGASVVYAMGNHDLRAGFEAVLGDRVGVTTVRGVRVVRLDSSVPAYGYGEIEASQLEWLRRELATPAQRGTVVVVHHPPTAASSPLLRALELQRPEELLAACSAGDVRLVLSGHYHHPLVATEAGLPVIVAPGITNTTDALAPSGRERATIGAGFAVVDLPVRGLPAAGLPRVTFVPAPGPDDGTELFDLTPDEVEHIARAAGPGPRARL
ncbi:metallophosphoesterase [Microbacterium sp. STN6]|uniref:metallophosphoesterase n=1 Tax=Microbacterium sp. STN6 TaxID=2995588 RepID=UPI002260BCC8|nr:metallophosphoesterase [Microbacterium sp. STN6]MCX7522941.1 metallophosphoesterase [Microbacterium sp. STN6]